MRVPIAYGLAWPGRVVSGAKALDFKAMGSMTFEAPDHNRFPGLQLAWDVLAAPVGTPAVLNAANEVAVAAFLDKKIRFDQIHALNRATLDAVAVPPVGGIEGLLELDAKTRAFAHRLADSMGR